MLSCYEGKVEVRETPPGSQNNIQWKSETFAWPTPHIWIDTTPRYQVYHLGEAKHNISLQKKYIFSPDGLHLAIFQCFRDFSFDWIKCEMIFFWYGRLHYTYSSWKKASVGQKILYHQDKSSYPHLRLWHRNLTCFLLILCFMYLEDTRVISHSTQIFQSRNFYCDIPECASSEHLLALLCFHSLDSDIGIVHASCTVDFRHLLKSLQRDHKVYSYSTPNPSWEIIRHDLLECVSSEHFLSLLCIHIIYIGVVHASCDEDSLHRLKPLEWNHKVCSYFHEANVFWECDSLKGLFELVYEHLDCDSSSGS